MNYILSVFNGTISALKATPAWAGNALHVLVGSRFYVAVCATFFFSFLAHLASAPSRFPPFVKVSPLAFAGIAPDVGVAPELPSEVSVRAQDAAQAGLGHVEGYLQAFFEADPQRVVYANQAGLAISGVALLLGIVLLSRQNAKKA